MRKEEWNRYIQNQGTGYGKMWDLQFKGFTSLRKNMRQNYQIKIQILEKSKILIKGVKRHCTSWKVYLLEEYTDTTEHCRIPIWYWW